MPGPVFNAHNDHCDEVHVQIMDLNNRLMVNGHKITLYNKINM